MLAGQKSVMNGKNKRIRTLLASTLFCALPMTTHAALTPLDALANNQNTSVAPYNTPQNGYLFTTPNITFTILDNVNLGLDNTRIIPQSIDNTNLTQENFDKLIFAGQSTVTGAIGFGVHNYICDIEIQGDPSKAVTFMSMVAGAPISITHSGRIILSDKGQILSSIDNTSANPGTGSLELQGAGQITGNIGQTLPLNLITLNTQSVGSKEVDLIGLLLNANIIHIHDDGSHPTTLRIGSNQGLQTVTGTFQTNTHDLNYMTINQGANITGDLGALNKALAKISLGLSADTYIDGDIYTTLLHFPGKGNLILGNNHLINGNIDGQNQASLIFAGNGTVTGSITGLNQIQLEGSNTITTLQGAAIDVGHFYFNDDGKNANTLVLSNPSMTLTGSVAAKTNNLNVLDMSQIKIFEGNIGAPNEILALVKVGEHGDTIIDGNIYADVVEFQGDHTLTMQNNGQIIGAITSLAPNEGTLNISGSSSSTSSIGTQSIPLNTINLYGPNGSTFGLHHPLFATNIHIDQASTLFTSSHHLNAQSLIVHPNSALSLTCLGPSLSAVNYFYLNENATLHIDFEGKLPSSPIFSESIVNIDPHAQLVFSHIPYSVRDGVTRIPIIAGGEGSVINEISATTHRLLLQCHTIADPVNNQLDLVVNALPVSLFSNYHTTGVAYTLDALVDQRQNGLFPPHELGLILDELDTFATQQQLNHALGELAPIHNHGVSTFSHHTQQHAFHVMASQLNHAPSHSGLNAGGMSQLPQGAWLQGFGEYAHQNNRNEISGYHGNMWGLVAGNDWLLTESTVAGFALSYAKANIDNTSPSTPTYAHTQIKSGQIALYGQTLFDCPFYMNWFAGVAYNQYDASRLVTFGNLLLSPKAHYHAWQYSAKTEVGLLSDLLIPYHLFPVASLYYSYLDFSDYTEQGAGTANQTVQLNHSERLQGGLGLKWITDYLYETTLFEPELRFIFLYDFLNDNVQSISQFTGAGPSFVTQGATLPRSSFDFGLSLTSLKAMTGISTTLSYDLNVQQGYWAHIGWARIRYEW